MEKIKKNFVIYPILVGALPLLTLMVANLTQIEIIQGQRALLLTVALSVVVFGLSWLLARDIQRGGLLASWALLLFLTYGHAYGFLKAFQIGGFFLFRHRTLVPLWLVLLVVGGWLILRKVRISMRFSSAMNVIFAILVGFQLVQIGAYQVQVRAAEQSPKANVVQASPTSTGQLPDVYYILMDGYSRQDVLQEKNGFDNSAFIADLEALGFYLPDCAQSNYALTPLSIGSSFQMDYLDALNQKKLFTKGLINYPEFAKLIKNSPIRRTLTGLGYETVAFDTFWPFLNLNDAEYYLAAGKKFLGRQAIFNEITNFETLYLQTTPVRAVMDTPGAASLLFGDSIKTYERLHYERILFQFDQLAQVPDLPGSKFVWAHIAAPHTPYVFNRDGSYKATDQADGMTEELIYINQRVIQMLKDILQKSKTPPVIIVQADHSKSDEVDQKMRILNAYYLPGGKNALLYPTITPVNTFRVVLNAYFGGQYPLLPDRSMYSVYGKPDQFQELPLDCMGQ